AYKIIINDNCCISSILLLMELFLRLLFFCLFFCHLFIHCSNTCNDKWYIITTANAILNNCNTIPLQLPPVTRKPLKIGGVLHGTNATVLGTRPVARAI